MRHTQCGGSVYVEVTSAFKLMAEISMDLANNSLQTVAIHTFQKKTQLKKVVFTCSRCNNIVEITDLKFQCRGCGDDIELKDTLVPTESNGNFCYDCAHNMFSEERLIKMEELLSKTLLYIV